MGYQRRQTRYCDLFPAWFFCGTNRNVCVTAVPVFLQNISGNTALLVKYVWGRGRRLSWLSGEGKINSRRFKMCLFVLVVKKKEPLDIRNFDYSARSWTGKSPKQFLIDWCRKNFPKSPNPAFEKVPVGKYWKCRYVFPIDFIFSS